MRQLQADGGSERAPGRAAPGPVVAPVASPAPARTADARLSLPLISALQGSAGNAAVGMLVARQKTGVPDERSTFPWLGRIDRTWSASLRETAEKPGGNPHGNTLADLPRGTDVRVTNRKRGWLRVEVTLDGKDLTGFVSQELVEYVAPSAYELPGMVIKVPSTQEAMLTLRRAEDRLERGERIPPEEREDLESAAQSMERAGYDVNRDTWRVVMAKPAAGSKREVHSIEDFVLFVEGVEHWYPSASPIEVASEIREMWFADPKWAVLLGSQGIREQGKLADMESKGPIADLWNMKQIAPNRKGLPADQAGLKIQTKMGLVDFSHVMAGIDAALSGSPSSYPEGFLEEREKQTGENEYDTYKNTAIYETLKERSGGDPRDFATWSGDLGQAYADYLFDVHQNGVTSKNLSHWVELRATRPQLLGDIQGYIALTVLQSVPAGDRPTGARQRVSDILRAMYLVPKRDQTSMETHFAKAAGVDKGKLGGLIRDRTLRFARLWFAKAVIADETMPTVRVEHALAKHGKTFDELHDRNEAHARKEDRLQALIDGLLADLRNPVQ
jgi:hypothetical protein